ISAMVLKPRLRISSASKALTVTGTDCRLSSVLRAVTTISWSPRAASPATAILAFRAAMIGIANRWGLHGLCVELGIFLPSYALLGDRFPQDWPPATTKTG